MSINQTSTPPQVPLVPESQVNSRNQFARQNEFQKFWMVFRLLVVVSLAQFVITMLIQTIPAIDENGSVKIEASPMTLFTILPIILSLVLIFGGRSFMMSVKETQVTDAADQTFLVPAYTLNPLGLVVTLLVVGSAAVVLFFYDSKGSERCSVENLERASASMGPFGMLAKLGCLYREHVIAAPATSPAKIISFAFQGSILIAMTCFYAIRSLSAKNTDRLRQKGQSLMGKVRNRQKTPAGPVLAPRPAVTNRVKRMQDKPMQKNQKDLKAITNMQKTFRQKQMQRKTNAIAGDTAKAQVVKNLQQKFRARQEMQKQMQRKTNAIAGDTAKAQVVKNLQQKFRARQAMKGQGAAATVTSPPSASR